MFIRSRCAIAICAAMVWAAFVATPGASAAPLPARLFLVPQGANPGDYPGGPTVIEVDAGLVQGGNLTMTLEIYIQETIPERVQGYQVALDDAVGGDAGIVHYDPGLPPQIDAGHPLYIFAAAATDAPAVDPGPPALLINGLGDPVLESVAVDTPRYLGEITYRFTPDALGSFMIEFIGPGALTVVIDDTGAPLPLIVDGALIDVTTPPGACCLGGACADDVREADCLGGGGSFVGPGTTCGLDDTDGDGDLDTCDPDDDNDGVPDGLDPDPLNPDVCGDSDGDTCDDCTIGTDDFGPDPDVRPDADGPDTDGDGQCDAGDPCPADDPDDSDGDGVCDSDDLCPGHDDNADADGDGVPDGCDVCPGANDNADADGDGVPDGCDICPGGDDLQDADGDGVPNFCDICAGHDDTADADGDGVPDGCDVCPGANDNADADSDGVPDGCDICPGGDDLQDADGDGVPNFCDICAGHDDTADADGDGVPDGCDVCPGANDNADADSDGVPDGCDICPGGDDLQDGDGDGVPNFCDICAGHDDTADADGDGVPDGCDVCPGANDNADADSDGVPDGCDICPGGDDLQDGDGDGVPNFCDICAGHDDTADADGDGVPDGCDICPGGSDLQDGDGDGVPDFCDACPGSDDSVDADGDGVPDGCDACPGANDLDDIDDDGIPDACDSCPVDDTNTCGSGAGGPLPAVNELRSADVAALVTLAHPREDAPAPSTPQGGDPGCQSPDQEGHGPACADVLINAVTSDIDGNWAAADKFSPTIAATINQVTWWGVYLENQFPQTDCAPGPGDQFTITYYADDAGGGWPGSVLASYDVTATRTSTGLTVGDLAEEFEYTAEHDDLEVSAGDCYWIEVQNDTTAGSGCIWLWETAPPGDGLSAQMASSDPAPRSYGPGTSRSHDLSWCLDDTGAGDVVVTPFGCGQIGACCDDVSAACTNGLTAPACLFDDDLCAFQPGARFHVDESCDMLERPCGTSACCMPDGSCLDVLPDECPGDFNPGTLCADLLCPIFESCSLTFGPGKAGTRAPATQYTGGTTTADFFAESAGDFALAGSLANDCEITHLRWWVRHFNASGGGCFDGTCPDAAPCDTRDPAACGGAPDDCVPDNPDCAYTPDDYQAVRVTLYDDAGDAGLLSDHLASCGGVIPQSDTLGAPASCTIDEDCAEGQVCFDNNGDGSSECCLVCELTVSDSALIADLDLDYRIEHTWQGDLVISLEHEDFGPPVRVMNRPGDTDIHGTGFASGGYPVDDFGISGLPGPLNDEAAVTINTYAGSGPGVPNYVGPASSGGGADPAGVLAQFDGQTRAGVWRLYVSDEFGAADQGTLLDWSLRLGAVEHMPPTGAPEHLATPPTCGGDADCQALGGTTCGGSTAGLCDDLLLPAPTGAHLGRVVEELTLSPAQFTWEQYEESGSVVDGAYLVTLDVSGLSLANLTTYWLAISPELPFEGYYQTAWMGRRSRLGETAALQAFEFEGLPPWQSAEVDVAFEIVGVPNPVLCPTGAHGECADRDLDGIRDDNCTWWACLTSICVATPIPFADMGGQFGECPPDGSADINDRFHALNCFANAGTKPPPDTYACEENSPFAFNVDAGGPFGDCAPDGVCDGHDAFHALNSFDGSSQCSCPPGAAPTAVAPLQVREQAALRLGVRGAARPAERILVDVFLDTALDDLRGYQLHLGTAGGQRGALQLVDILVEARKDRALPPTAWTAFNLDTGQALVGLDAPGVAVPAGAYLATFVYRPTADAAGVFSVDLLHDPLDPAQRTFLFPTAARGGVGLDAGAPARVSVVAERKRKDEVGRLR